MSRSIHSLCVFCGSSPGSRSEYLQVARDLGRLLADRKIRLIYGGGNVGLMGGLAESCMASGGEVIGVMPDALVRREVAHTGVTELHVVESMHERKAMMADLADAFLAMPGGIGTLEELFEIWTWSQLGLHTKPLGLLNVAGYYDHLLAFTLHAVRERFLREENRSVLLVGTDPTHLLDQLTDFAPLNVTKWIDRDQT